MFSTLTQKKYAIAAAILAIGLTSGRQANAQGQAVGGNFTASTISESGFIPPDTMGTVGLNHVMLLINGRYELYSKDSTGTPVVGHATSLNNFWSTIAGVSGRSGNAFDPRVLYDPFSQRYYAVSVDGGDSANSGYLVAVSQTRNPTDGWKGFRFDADSTNVRWADYPMLGIDGQYLYVSTNMFLVTGQTGSSQGHVHAIPKADLLLATPTGDNRQTFTNFGLSSNQPAHALDNATPSSKPFHFLHQSGNTIFFDSLTGSGGTLAEAVNFLSRTLTSSGFNTATSARQPDGTANLDVVDIGRLTARPVRINGSYWGTQVRKVGSDNIVRWFEFNDTTLAIKQQGVVTIPGQDLFDPSLSVNSRGDVVIGFTASGPSAGQYPSAYAAVGRTSGGVTTFDAPMLLKAGVASYYVDYGTGRNRWGDYSNTENDPADPNIFWAFQEWASGATSWSVQASEIVTYAANEVYWKTNASSGFAQPSNWLTGAAPAAADHAIVSRAGTGFTISLAASATNDRLSVRQGAVTFSLPAGVNYALTKTSTSSPSVTVGEFGGTSTMTVTGGGTLSGVNTAVGGAAPLAAAVALSGSGTTWRNSGNFYLGGSAGGPGAAASLSVGANTLLDVAGTLRIYDGSPVTINGRIRAGNLNVDQSLNVSASGVLRAAGQVAGTLTNSGRIEPGNSPGTLTAGNLVLGPTSVMAFELGTPGVLGESDLLLSLGDLTLDGTLEVSALTGFGPGDYTLLEYAGGLVDNGLILGAVPSGYTYALEVDSLGKQVLLHVVPEPSTLALLAAMAITALAAARRRAMK